MKNISPVRFFSSSIKEINEKRLADKKLMMRARSGDQDAKKALRAVYRLKLNL